MGRWLPTWAAAGSHHRFRAQVLIAVPENDQPPSEQLMVALGWSLESYGLSRQSVRQQLSVTKHGKRFVDLGEAFEGTYGVVRLL
eukprot:Skav200049  [mRNA]  locus=scaffold337:548242:552627:+ [translate_table: standard]